MAVDRNTFKPHPPSEILPRLVRWGESRPAVRLMLLTGSRAAPHARVDDFSDYDVILILQDIYPFYHDRAWLADFGELLVTYWDPLEAFAGDDLPHPGGVIQYANGLHIDFSLWPIELLRRSTVSHTLPSELDAGYQVLLDKDGMASQLPAPTGKAYLPHPPTEAAFLRHVEEFFSDVPYVAKCLLRHDLLPAKWCLDYDMKHVYLRPLLEWRAACDTHWSQPADLMGKGLKRRLPPELWSKLETAYAGAAIEDNWRALFNTLDVFRLAGLEVAARLGYAYPHDLDRRVTAYLKTMQASSRSRDDNLF